MIDDSSSQVNEKTFARLALHRTAAHTHTPCHCQPWLVAWRLRRSSASSMRIPPLTPTLSASECTLPFESPPPYTRGGGGRCTRTHTQQYNPQSAFQLTDAHIKLCAPLHAPPSPRHLPAIYKWQHITRSLMLCSPPLSTPASSPFSCQHEHITLTGFLRVDATASISHHLPSLLTHPPERLL